jgi:hypothetical protein
VIEPADQSVLLTVARLPAAAAGFGGFLAVIGEIARVVFLALVLAADMAGFGGLLAVIGEVAGVVLGDPFTSPCLRASDWVGSPG